MACDDTADGCSCGGSAVCIRKCIETSSSSDFAEVLEGVAGQLSEYGGCGDVSLRALAPGGAMELAFGGPALAELAHQMSAPQSRMFALPDAEVTLVLKIGACLGGEFCNDTPAEPPEQVDHQYTAVRGTLTLEVTPTGVATEFSFPADAVLHLEDVVLETDGLRDVTISSLSVSAGVGWFPG